jgi:hypothetical protein
MLNFYRPFFIPCFGSHFENDRHLEKRRIAPLMVTYQYFKFYVSIIIHLEVININENFYRSPFSKWPPQYANIQHCPISSKFDIWVDNDVPNWFPTLKNFYRSPFSKWSPQKFNIVRYHQNLICSIAPLMVTYHYVKFYVSIIIHLVVININVRNFNFPILKNFYRSPFSKWSPQKFNIVRYHQNLIFG